MRAHKITKTGKIIPNGVKSAPHELDTILFFTEIGKDVELIPPSNTPHSKRPDCIINGIEWEIKSPTINKRRTIERLFYSASNQSSNIIIDCRRLKQSDQSAIKVFEQCFKNTRKVRKMRIIDKSHQLKLYDK